VGSDKNVMLSAFKNYIRNGIIHNLKVDFLIVGAQKAGTHALYNMLNSSKNIYGGLTKETDFFLSTARYRKGYDFYHSFFYNRELIFKKHLNFEASVGYMYYRQAIPRMYKYNPKIKLVIILRDPIARCYSAYNMLKDIYLHTKEKTIKYYLSNLDFPAQQDGISFLNQVSFPEFKDQILKEIKIFNQKGIQYTEPGIVFKSIYSIQIKNLLKYFPKEQLFFIESDDLKYSPQESIKKLSAFLNIKDIDISDSTINKDHFKGNYGPTMDSEVKDMLKDFFKPYNQELYQLIEKKFDW
jgi:hypothetical protein